MIMAYWRYTFAKEALQSKTLQAIMCIWETISFSRTFLDIMSPKPTM